MIVEFVYMFLLLMAANAVAAWATVKQIYTECFVLTEAVQHKAMLTEYGTRMLDFSLAMTVATVEQLIEAANVVIYMITQCLIHFKRTIGYTPMTSSVT
jgi:hypothetical protein